MKSESKPETTTSTPKTARKAELFNDRQQLREMLAGPVAQAWLVMHADPSVREFDRSGFADNVVALVDELIDGLEATAK